MDAVNAFNTELFSMIDMKPPISRAKMMSVTKSAIKAIKLYKHVVQIVEKFIKKCKPELKVPGLYVVDSIIRQSRHQFGIEKDVFAPRFVKNFTDTFQNLYLCPEDDKTKILRVLNLWQKNGVFDMDIIQPLMDLINGAIATAPAPEVPNAFQPESQPVTSASAVPAVSQLPTPDALAAVAQLFQSPHGQELQRMLQNFQQAEKTLSAAVTNNVPTPPQMSTAHLHPYEAHRENNSSLAEKLLDRFDYDDEPEDTTTKEGSSHLHGGPEIVFNHFHGQMPNAENVHPHMMGRTTEHGERMSHDDYHMMPDGYRPGNEAYSQARGNSREDSAMRREGRQRGYGWRSRSRSGSRSPRRRRSRSTSRSRKSRHRESRWRSRSPERGDREKDRGDREKDRGDREKDRGDRGDREKDRERRQKGLPSTRSQTLSVCSTTLWVGQLDKKTQQSDVMSLLEEFGQIDSINMIPPRGCAYIAMVHRQDAFTALNKLSRGSYKVNQKPVKIAWALNKGIKAAHKKFWDVEQGVTYIPWNKVKVEDLESFREGGILDPETLKPEWINAKDTNEPAAVNGALESVPADGTIAAHVQVPPVEKAPMGSPPAFPGPIMLSPNSMHLGGAPFIPAELNPAVLALAASVKQPEESTKDSRGDKGKASDAGTDNALGSPGAPMMPMPGPGVMPMPGPRPGMPPMQPPPGMPNPFLPPPNMPHMPPQMMFPPDRFRMPMSFPPRGPPFPPRHPSFDMGDGDGRQFRNGRPGFGPPPFLRGRW